MMEIKHRFFQLTQLTSAPKWRRRSWRAICYEGLTEIAIYRSLLVAIYNLSSSLQDAVVSR